MEELCTACMCSGRNLYLLNESGLNHVYEEIVKEISISECLNTKSVQICWECRALLRRFQRFKLQAQKCYIELLEHLQQDPPSVPKARPSQLQLHIAHNLSYHIPNQTDEPIELLYDVKIESVDDEIESVPYFVMLDEGDEEPKVDEKKESHKGKVKRKIRRRKRRAESELIIDSVSHREYPAVEHNENLEKVNGERTEEIEETHKRRVSMRIRKKKPRAEPEISDGISDRENQEALDEDVYGEKPKRRTRCKEVLPDKPTCTDCGKTFSSKKTYRYHRNVLHKGQNRHPCPRCGRVYQWKSNLGRHMRTHRALDTGELYCEKCNRTFASVATYRQHMRISRWHVPESDYNFMCNECGKKFLDKTRLKDHIDWEHLKKVKYRCQICKNAFKCHATLYVHMQNIHSNKEKKSHLCHVCGRSYQSASKLKHHIVAMHTSQTPHRCGQCGAAFGWYSSLYRHVRDVHYRIKVATRNAKKSKKS